MTDIDDEKKYGCPEFYGKQMVKKHINEIFVTKDDTHKVSPCPFCGSTNTERKHITHTYWIRCHDCKTCGPSGRAASVATRKWNTRHEPCGSSGRDTMPQSILIEVLGLAPGIQVISMFLENPGVAYSPFAVEKITGLNRRTIPPYLEMYEKKGYLLKKDGKFILDHENQMVIELGTFMSRAGDLLCGFNVDQRSPYSQP